MNLITTIVVCCWGNVTNEHNNSIDFSIEKMIEIQLVYLEQGYDISLQQTYAPSHLEGQEKTYLVIHVKDNSIRNK